MRASSWLRTAVLSAGLVILAGCYTYRPIQDATVGTRVRVHVPVQSAVADPNAPPQSVTVEGDVLSSPSDTIVLAMQTRREVGAFREIVQFDTLRLSPDQRLAVELREFSTGRSIALGAGITAGVVGLATVAFGLAGGQDGEEGPGTNPPNPSVVVSRALVSRILGLVGR